MAPKDTKPSVYEDETDNHETIIDDKITAENETESGITSEKTTTDNETQENILESRPIDEIQKQTKMSTDDIIKFITSTNTELSEQDSIRMARGYKILSSLLPNKFNKTTQSPDQKDDIENWIKLLIEAGSENQNENLIKFIEKFIESSKFGHLVYKNRNEYYTDLELLYEENNLSNEEIHLLLKLNKWLNDFPEKDYDLILKFLGFEESIIEILTSIKKGEIETDKISSLIKSAKLIQFAKDIENPEKQQEINKKLKSLPEFIKLDITKKRLTIEIEKRKKEYENSGMQFPEEFADLNNPENITLFEPWINDPDSSTWPIYALRKLKGKPQLKGLFYYITDFDLSKDDEKIFDHLEALMNAGLPKSFFLDKGYNNGSLKYEINNFDFKDIKHVIKTAEIVDKYFNNPDLGFVLSDVDDIEDFPMEEFFVFFPSKILLEELRMFKKDEEEVRDIIQKSPKAKELQRLLDLQSIIEFHELFDVILNKIDDELSAEFFKNINYEPLEKIKKWHFLSQYQESKYSLHDIDWLLNTNPKLLNEPKFWQYKFDKATIESHPDVCLEILSSPFLPTIWLYGYQTKLDINELIYLKIKKPHLFEPPYINSVNNLFELLEMQKEDNSTGEYIDYTKEEIDTILKYQKKYIIHTEEFKEFLKFLTSDDFIVAPKELDQELRKKCAGNYDWKILKILSSYRKDGIYKTEMSDYFWKEYDRYQSKELKSILSSFKDNTDSVVYKTTGIRTYQLRYIGILNEFINNEYKMEFLQILSSTKHIDQLNFIFETITYSHKNIDKNTLDLLKKIIDHKNFPILHKLNNSTYVSTIKYPEFIDQFMDELTPEIIEFQKRIPKGIEYNIEHLPIMFKHPDIENMFELEKLINESITNIYRIPFTLFCFIEAKKTLQQFKDFLKELKEDINNNEVLSVLKVVKMEKEINELTTFFNFIIRTEIDNNAEDIIERLSKMNPLVRKQFFSEYKSKILDYRIFDYEEELIKLGISRSDLLELTKKHYDENIFPNGHKLKNWQIEYLAKDLRYTNNFIKLWKHSEGTKEVLEIIIYSIKEAENLRQIFFYYGIDKIQNEKTLSEKLSADLKSKIVIKMLETAKSQNDSDGTFAIMNTEFFKVVLEGKEILELIISKTVQTKTINYIFDFENILEAMKTLTIKEKTNLAKELIANYEKWYKYLSNTLFEETLNDESILNLIVQKLKEDTQNLASIFNNDDYRLILEKLTKNITNKSKVDIAEKTISCYENWYEYLKNPFFYESFNDEKIINMILQKLKKDMQILATILNNFSYRFMEDALTKNTTKEQKIDLAKELINNHENWYIYLNNNFFAGVLNDETIIDLIVEKSNKNIEIFKHVISNWEYTSIAEKLTQQTTKEQKIIIAKELINNHENWYIYLNNNFFADAVEDVKNEFIESLSDIEQPETARVRMLKFIFKVSSLNQYGFDDDIFTKLLKKCEKIPSNERMDYITDFTKLLDITNTSRSAEVQKIQVELLGAVLDMTDSNIDGQEKLLKKLIEFFEKNNIPICGKVAEVFRRIYSKKRLIKIYNNKKFARFTNVLQQLDLQDKTDDPEYEKEKDNKYAKLLVLFRNDLLHTALRSNDNNLRNYFEKLNKFAPLMDKYQELVEAGDDKALQSFIDSTPELANAFEVFTVVADTIKTSDSQKHQEYPKTVEDFHKLEKHIKKSFSPLNKKIDISSHFIKVFFGSFGIKNPKEALKYMDTVKDTTTKRNQDFAEKGHITLMSDDYVKGMTVDAVDYVFSVGNKGREFLGESTQESDATPFDVDWTRVNKDIDPNMEFKDIIQGTSYPLYSGGESGIGIIIKNRGQFYDKKTYREAIEAMKDINGLYETVHSGSISAEYSKHYGIRTAIPVSEFSAVIVNPEKISDYETVLRKIKENIALSGIYIPICDTDGNVIYSYREWEGLKEIAEITKKLMDEEESDAKFNEPTMKTVNGPSGSTQCQWFEDSSGKKYLYKFYGDLLKSINESFYCNLYRELGFKAPTTHLGKYNSKTAFVSEEIKNSKNANSGPQESVDQEKIKGFVADCLFANWDAPQNDNIRYTQNENGSIEVWRVDNGGAGIYRAREHSGMESIKKSEEDFGETIIEFETFFDQSKNSGYLKYKDKITTDMIIEQGEHILSILTPENLDKIYTKSGMQSAEMGESRRSNEILKQRIQFLTQKVETLKKQRQKEVRELLKDRKFTKIISSYGENPDPILGEIIPLWNELNGENGYQHNQDHIGQHTLKVLELLKSSKEYSSFSREDKDIALLASFFHDFGKAHGPKGTSIPRDYQHDEKSAKMAEKYMKMLGYSDEDINLVKLIITNDGQVSDWARGKNKDLTIEMLRNRMNNNSRAIKILKAMNEADVRSLKGGNEKFKHIAEKYNQFFSKVGM